VLLSSRFPVARRSLHYWHDFGFRQATASVDRIVWELLGVRGRLDGASSLSAGRTPRRIALRTGHCRGVRSPVAIL